MCARNWPQPPGRSAAARSRGLADLPYPRAVTTDPWRRAEGRLIPGAARLLDVSLVPLLRGTGDVTLRRTSTGWWRAVRTPEGPGLQHLVRADADVRVDAWGPGASWLVDQSPRLLGQHDMLDGFEPRHHPLVAEAHRRRAWLRLGRTDLLLDALAPASIEQVVTGKEAFRAQRLLVLRFGDAAGGPAQEPGHPAHGMRLPLSAEQWLAVPSWEFLKAGVESRRSRALLAGARAGHSLERLALDDWPGDPDAALRSLPGVGPWTSAQVRQRALGDADAWSIGDYHAGKQISYAFTGEALDDAAAEELLEPFRGHRFRVERLVLSLVAGPARRGPRRTLPTHLPR